MTTFIKDEKVGGWRSECVIHFGTAVFLYTGFSYFCTIYIISRRGRATTKKQKKEQNIIKWFLSMFFSLPENEIKHWRKKRRRMGLINHFRFLFANSRSPLKKKVMFGSFFYFSFHFNLYSSIFERNKRLLK